MGLRAGTRRLVPLARETLQPRATFIDVDDRPRNDAVSRLAKAILDLVDSGTETLADDIWAACAEAGSELRRRTPGAAPVARADKNVEALGRLDQASARFDGFAYFLLSPLGVRSASDDQT
jgi:hypothetical protein